MEPLSVNMLSEFPVYADDALRNVFNTVSTSDAFRTFADLNRVPASMTWSTRSTDPFLFLYEHQIKYEALVELDFIWLPYLESNLSW